MGEGSGNTPDGVCGNPAGLRISQRNAVNDALRPVMVFRFASLNDRFAAVSVLRRRAVTSRVHPPSSCSSASALANPSVGFRGTADIGGAQVRSGVLKVCCLRLRISTAPQSYLCGLTPIDCGKADCLHINANPKSKARKIALPLRTMRGAWRATCGMNCFKGSC